MSDLRSHKPTKLQSPDIEEYSINSDKRGGFNVKLKWKDNTDSIVLYRIYKSKISKSLLQKDFKLTQRALEKLSPSNTKNNNTNILYNKIFFVQNSKVNFFSGNSNFNQKETFPKNYSYFSIGSIKKNKFGAYEFIDKNVKFGQSYAYLIKGVDTNLQETISPSPTIINIEDLEYPQNINNINITEYSNSILLIFNVENNSKIYKYDIFRRKIGDLNFQKISSLYSTKKNEKYTDYNIIPGNEYEYKIYPIDYFDNIAWSSPIKKIEFKSNFLSKGAVPDPIVHIFYDGGNVSINGFKNDDKIIGYKIERKDLWKYEQNFSIKENDAIQWPGVIFFENDKIKFTDRSIIFDKEYQYRISSISKNSKVESIFITQPFKFDQNLNIISKKSDDEQNQNKIFIKNFDAEIRNLKQNPLYLKISWDIEGVWDTIKIVLNDKEILVDNVHKFIFIPVNKKEKFKIKLKIYNNKIKIKESEEIIIKT